MALGELKPRASTHFGGPAHTEGFEFRISGIHRPNLELLLDPGVAFYSERGSPTQRTGVRDRFALGHGYFPTFVGTGIGMVNRMIGGGTSSWLLTKYRNREGTPQLATVTAPEGSVNLVAIDLDAAGGSIMCKRKSYFGHIHHPDQSGGFGKAIRPGWGLDLQLWHWLGIPSLALGEQTFLWQKIRAPKSVPHFQKAAGYKLPELPNAEPSENPEAVDTPLASRNWVFLHTPGDVVVLDLKEKNKPTMIQRGTLQAMTPHVKRGAWFTKSGLVSNAINLGPQNDGESFLSPTFSARGNDIIQVKGPCRLWVSETNMDFDH